MGYSVSIANLTANGHNAGGFVGQTEGTSFVGCAAFGDNVSSYDSAGGFVGFSSNASYQASLSANHVSGYSNLGGFAGGTSSLFLGYCYAFTTIDCSGNTAYFFSKEVSYFSPSVINTAYYYTNGCVRGSCIVASGIKPIEMSGMSMTTPSFGSHMSCKVPFGNGHYSISIPDGIQELVSGDICN